MPLGKLATPVYSVATTSSISFTGMLPGSILHCGSKTATVNSSGAATISGLSMNTSYNFYCTLTNWADSDIVSAATIKGTLLKPTFSAITSTGFTINNSNAIAVTVSTTGGTLSKTTIAANSTATLTGCSIDTSYTITFSATNYNNISASQTTAKGTMSAPTFSSVLTTGFTITNPNNFSVNVSTSGGTLSSTTIAANSTTKLTGCSMDTSYTITFNQTHYNSASASQRTSKGTLSAPTFTNVTESGFTIKNPNSVTVTVISNGGTLGSSTIAAGKTTNLTNCSMNTSYTITFSAQKYNDKSASQTTAKGSLNAPTFSNVTSSGFTITNPNNVSVTVSSTGGSLSSSSIAANGTVTLSNCAIDTSYTITFSKTNYNNVTASQKQPLEH